MLNFDDFGKFSDFWTIFLRLTKNQGWSQEFDTKNYQNLIYSQISQTTEGTHGNLISNIASCCCIKPIKSFDEVTQYLAPRAFVFVAKDGLPFLKSGKQAYNLVSQRIMDIVALAHYGDIAMFACKILIAVISAVVGYAAIWMKVCRLKLGLMV